MTMTDGVRELVVGGTLTLDTTERAGEVHADVPGGSALYAATAASVALPARIVGTVGTDVAFDALRDVWSRGVDPSAIEILEGRTFRWHARYDADGDDRVTLARDRGVADGRTPPVPAHRDSSYALLLGSTNPRIQQGLRDASRCPRGGGSTACRTGGASARQDTRPAGADRRPVRGRG
jgi:sugar/nucleoside kinase (ribokinase family)